MCAMSGGDMYYEKQQSWEDNWEAVEMGQGLQLSVGWLGERDQASYLAAWLRALQAEERARALPGREQARRVQKLGQQESTRDEVTHLGARERLWFHPEREERPVRHLGREMPGREWGSSLTVPKCLFSWVEPLMLEASWEIPFQWKCWFMKVYLVQCNKSHKAEYILSLKNSMPRNSSWG